MVFITKTTKNGVLIKFFKMPRIESPVVVKLFSSQIFLAMLESLVLKIIVAPLSIGFVGILFLSLLS